LAKTDRLARVHKRPSGGVDRQGFAATNSTGLYYDRILSRKNVIGQTLVIEDHSGHHTGGLHDSGGAPSALHRQA